LAAVRADGAEPAMVPRKDPRTGPGGGAPARGARGGGGSGDLRPGTAGGRGGGSPDWRDGGSAFLGGAGPFRVSLRSLFLAPGAPTSPGGRRTAREWDRTARPPPSSRTPSGAMVRREPERLVAGD